MKPASPANMMPSMSDHKQLIPLVISNNVGLNPFASQLEYSLFTRLVLSGHQTCELILFERMHSEILRFPNKRTYNGKLKAASKANTRALPEGYIKWYQKYFKQ